MYVDISSLCRNGKTYTRYLLRECYREEGKVKHRTIANLNRCSPEEIEAIRLALREATGERGFIVSVEEGSAVEDIALLAPAFLAQFLLFLASLFFFVATRHQIRATILGIVFSRRLRWRVAHVFRDVEALVSRYLLSIAAINLGLGIAVTLALWMLGVPSPALWGALAGLLNFVMYIGPAIMAAILFAIGLATTDTLMAAFLPPLVYLTLNMIEAQFVTPAVVGRTLMLNPFAVLLALSFWIWIWGPIGGFIAIPAMLVVIAIARNVVPTINVDGSFR
jgi:predicted PurR-regulated permease PerM